MLEAMSDKHAGVITKRGRKKIRRILDDAELGKREENVAIEKVLELRSWTMPLHFISLYNKLEFMWENIIQSVRKFRSSDSGLGCILAHTVGLVRTNWSVFLQDVPYGFFIIFHFSSHS
ncbi:hypothetical protein C2S52_008049 [Perilla frutescens var. hirtella]|uniref:Uncharacterized protein n=1 Tax=Perilla frutescens var. hirtella TaxID=608512 RepID=A0AAD4NWZ7_PERFH|nr:hypothetical protein C2S53_010151 [Perilla frutescens var. hirtella]KAH6761235.1 hypothetical protein C2S51_018184 [Perilla frutescens var. frutescens]KAH6783090.1 hypothetical protein C2S52_008049 [Perilla frutescens var. hirtella]